MNARWGHWVDRFKDAQTAEIRSGKFPVSITSTFLIRVNNPSEWTTFDSVVRAFHLREGKVAGLAFLLNETDGFVGIDIDNCLDSNGLAKVWAQPILDKFETYWEKSPSGRGIKGIIRAKLPLGVRQRNTIGDGSVELYATNRFFAITGHIIDGASRHVEPCQPELDWLLNHLGAFGASQRPRELNERRWPEPDLAEITENCAWLRHCRDDAETLPEIEWYPMLGVVGRCKDGEHFAHEWSRPYGGYSKAETSSKLQQAIRNAGPVLCETVATKLGQERFCGACAHRAKNSSPITIQKATPSLTAEARPLALHAPQKIFTPTLDEIALYGIAGEFVRLVEPQSEADPASLLFQFLVAAGIYLGRYAYFQVESDRHFTNLYTCIVGETSKARKGTSWGRVRAVLTGCDPEFEAKRISTGLSSGEGLIWAIRDPIEEWKPVENDPSQLEKVITDPGEDDKRLLVIEPEFARVLQVMRREGNTLSPTIRQGWDGQKLGALVKKQAASCLNPHVGIIGHITKEELVKNLSEIESANGFANRFMFSHARRARCLPFGGNLSNTDLEPISRRLKLAAEFAHTSANRMLFDKEAAKVWTDIYPKLSEGKPGLFGAITARAEAQVVRLATLYAVLDESKVILREHLDAALAVWRYSEESARFIFGDALGDATADSIQHFLTVTGAAGATRTDISNHLGKHKKSTEIDRALGVLQSRGLANRVQEETGGRRTERWFSLENAK